MKMPPTSRKNNKTPITPDATYSLRSKTPAGKIKNYFSLQNKLDAVKYSRYDFVRMMEGEDFTIAFIQACGFHSPLLFVNTDGLGLRVPSKEFTVNDICLCIGPNRILDVMDVTRQVNFNMTMYEWTKYFADDKKDKILNVSLEFSNTDLSDKIQIPTIVEELDWFNCAWPEHLKEEHPFLQKYCFMSVEGCFTDFHVNVGGTTAWYHILRGTKAVWFIPPTEENLVTYQKWALTEKKQRKFLGDIVNECSRELFISGDTLFIPAGWIYAVYTQNDSLVFGGKFLNSFSIQKQLRIAEVEESIKVPNELRYPLFTSMLWYVLERYVEHDPLQHINIPLPEYGGIIAIVQYLFFLPHKERNIPQSIDAVQLIRNFTEWRRRHLNDNTKNSVTGISCLKKIVLDK